MDFNLTCTFILNLSNHGRRKKGGMSATMQQFHSNGSFQNQPTASPVHCHQLQVPSIELNCWTRKELELWYRKKKLSGDRLVERMKNLVMMEFRATN